MVNIILAFMVGMLVGGICVYASYREKFNWAMDALRELDAKSMELKAKVEALRLFYGITEDDDA